MVTDGANITPNCNPQNWLKRFVPQVATNEIDFFGLVWSIFLAFRLVKDS